MSDNSRERQVNRGRKLEYFTVIYNSMEGLVSIVAGLFAGSVSLIGFGIDSVIEVTSGAALLWRLRHEYNPARRESAERTTLRIVGICFVALAMVPIIAGEGYKSLKGKKCRDNCACH